MFMRGKLSSKGEKYVEPKSCDLWVAQSGLGLQEVNFGIMSGGS